MLRFVLVETAGMFDRSTSRQTSETGLLWFLEALARWNRHYLAEHPELPRLYDSGVVYDIPQQYKKPISEKTVAAIAKMLRDDGGDDDLVRAVTAICQGCEWFRDVAALYERGSGDCFPLSQRLIVRSKSTGQYEILALSDLRFAYPAYEALSYNFAKQQYEFKNIVGFVDKGVKPVIKARLNNGTDLVSTSDHKFWTLDGGHKNNLTLTTRTMGEYLDAYQGFGAGRYTKAYRTNHSRILQAARIPALDVVKPSKSEAYLAGIYAAEGEHADGAHTRIGQHKPRIRAKIEEALADVGTSFHYRPGGGRTPGSGAQYSLHGGATNPIVAMMRAQGTSSFDKCVPQAFLSGDEETVARVLEGHGDGDAWRPLVGDSKFARPGVSAIYATSSDRLMEQLRLGLLITGRPLYAYKYADHQGEGNAPIWRLHEYDEHATRLQSREALLHDDLPGLRYGTVRNAMSFGEAHVGCIEVEDNHNFFLSDGTLVSNCDNVAAARTAEIRNAGVAASNCMTNRVRADGGTTYHALVRWPGNTTEDPSLLLGMGGAERAADRAEEIRKNKERYVNLVGAAKTLCDMGRMTTQQAGRQIDALGLLPRKKTW